MPIAHTYPSVKVQMTDEDVIRKCYAIIKFGVVAGPYDTRPGCKPRWDWHVARLDEAMTLMAAIWPHMGSRRREQIRSTLAALAGPLTRVLGFHYVVAVSCHLSRLPLVLSDGPAR